MHQLCHYPAKKGPTGEPWAWYIEFGVETECATELEYTVLNGVDEMDRSFGKPCGAEPIVEEPLERFWYYLCRRNRRFGSLIGKLYASTLPDILAKENGSPLIDLHLEGPT